MSCLSVSMTPVGGITSSARMVDGGLTASAINMGGIVTKAEMVGGIRTEVKRKGGISCRFFQECRTGLTPYLEIAPTVVWVLAGWTSNDVYSNTDWNIN